MAYAEERFEGRLFERERRRESVSAAVARVGGKRSNNKVREEPDARGMGRVMGGGGNLMEVGVIEIDAYLDQAAVGKVDTKDEDLEEVNGIFWSTAGNTHHRDPSDT